MSSFKLAKKDALSCTRTNIYDLHEKKLEYFLFALILLVPSSNSSAHFLKEIQNSGWISKTIKSLIQNVNKRMDKIWNYAYFGMLSFVNLSKPLQTSLDLSKYALATTLPQKRKILHLFTFHNLPNVPFPITSI